MSNKQQKVIMRLPEGFAEEFENNLKKHGRVKVHGLGIFEIRVILARNVKVPFTEKEIEIPAHKRIGFKPTATLKNKIKW